MPHDVKHVGRWDNPNTRAHLCSLPFYDTGFIYSTFIVYNIQVEWGIVSDGRSHGRAGSGPGGGGEGAIRWRCRVSWDDLDAYGFALVDDGSAEAFEGEP